jgi:hypothetical protein
MVPATEDMEETETAIATKSASLNTPNVGLVCPFSKQVVEQSAECHDCFLNIPHLKLHLKTFHTPRFSCELCGTIFGSEDTLEQHVHNALTECSPFIGFKNVAFITAAQAEKLESPFTGPVAAQWFAIFDIIFPGCERPLSPFFNPQKTLQSDLGLMVFSLRNQGFDSTQLPWKLENRGPRSVFDSAISMGSGSHRAGHVAQPTEPVHDDDTATNIGSTDVAPDLLANLSEATRNRTAMAHDSQCNKGNMVSPVQVDMNVKFTPASSSSESRLRVDKQTDRVMKHRFPVLVTPKILALPSAPISPHCQVPVFDSTIDKANVSVQAGDLDARGQAEFVTEREPGEPPASFGARSPAPSVSSTGADDGIHLSTPGLSKGSCSGSSTFLEGGEGPILSEETEILRASVQIVFGLELEEWGMPEGWRPLVLQFLQGLYELNEDYSDGSDAADFGPQESNQTTEKVAGFVSWDHANASSKRARDMSDTESRARDESREGNVKVATAKRPRKEASCAVRFSCPYRKKCPARFNVREKFSCSMTYFNSMSKVM